MLLSQKMMFKMDLMQKFNNQCGVSDTENKPF